MSEGSVRLFLDIWARPQQFWAVNQAVSVLPGLRMQIRLDFEVQYDPTLNLLRILLHRRIVRVEAMRRC